MVSVKQIHEIFMCLGKVVPSANAYRFFEKPWILHRNINGMVRPHAASGSFDIAASIFKI